MANDAYTKVKVIKGSYTHQMRCNLKLDKIVMKAIHIMRLMRCLLVIQSLDMRLIINYRVNLLILKPVKILRKDMWDENMSERRFMQIIYMEKNGQIIKE